MEEDISCGSLEIMELVVCVRWCKSLSDGSCYGF